MGIDKIKTPPSNTNIERSVLSCLHLDPDLLYVTRLSKERFTGLYVQLYDKMSEMINNKRYSIENITTRAQEQDISPDDIYDILTHEITTQHYEVHTQELRDMYVWRRLTELGRKVSVMSTDKRDVTEIVSVINSAYEVVSIQEEGEQTYEQQMDSIEHQIIDETYDRSIYSGLSCIDEKLGGFVGGQLVTIGARPGVGKSAVMINMMINQATTGLRVALFSLEMSAKEQVMRLCSNVSNIPFWKIKKKKRTEDEKEEVRAFVQSIKEQRIIVDDRSLSLDAIEKKIRILARKEKIEIFYLDYLQLIPKNSDNRNFNSIGNVTRQLKKIANELGVVIVMGSQLSRDIEKRLDKTPQLSDLRESGDIEQDSDVVLMLARDIEEDPQTMQIYIRKNRNGEMGVGFSTFVGEVMQLQDMTASQLKKTQNMYL